MPDGIGGYILYDIGTPVLYRIDLETLDMVTIELKSRALAISQDNTRLAYLEYDVDKDYKGYFVLMDLDDFSELFRSEIPEQYKQGGDIFFSYNNHYIVFAVAKNTYDNEASAMYIINIDEGTSTEMVSVNGGYIRVYGWEGDEPICSPKVKYEIHGMFEYPFDVGCG